MHNTPLHPPNWHYVVNEIASHSKTPKCVIVYGNVCCFRLLLLYQPNKSHFRFCYATTKMSLCMSSIVSLAAHHATTATLCLSFFPLFRYLIFHWLHTRAVVFWRRRCMMSTRWLTAIDVLAKVCGSPFFHMFVNIWGGLCVCTELYSVHCAVHVQLYFPTLLEGWMVRCVAINHHHKHTQARTRSWYCIAGASALICTQTVWMWVCLFWHFDTCAKNR